ncbi:MAG: hypothetical protein M1840_000346 [Geoglossum simile]|nr:MAG: hypothetical protein M1840_000346 [Geoglossum simile]
MPPPPTPDFVAAQSSSTTSQSFSTINRSSSPSSSQTPVIPSSTDPSSSQSSSQSVATEIPRGRTSSRGRGRGKTLSVMSRDSSSSTTHQATLAQLVKLLREPENKDKRITLNTDGAYFLTDPDPDSEILEIQVLKKSYEDPEKDIPSTDEQELSEEEEIQEKKAVDIPHMWSDNHAMANWWDRSIRDGLAVKTLDQFLSVYEYIGDSSSSYVSDLFDLISELRQTVPTNTQPLELKNVGPLTNIDLQLSHWDSIDQERTATYVQERFIAARFEHTYRALQKSYEKRGEKEKTAATKAKKIIKEQRILNLTPDKISEYWKRKHELSKRWYALVERFGWGSLLIFPSNPNIISHKFWESKTINIKVEDAFISGLETALPSFREASQIFAPHVLHYFKNRSFVGAPLLPFENLPEGTTKPDYAKFIAPLKRARGLTLTLLPPPPVEKKARPDPKTNYKSKAVVEVGSSDEEDEDDSA